MEQRQKMQEFLERAEGFQLREAGVPCLVGFGPKNDDIGAKNGYFWNYNIEISI